MSVLSNIRSDFFDFLSRHRNLHYIASCIKHFGDEERYQQIFPRDLFPFYIRIQNYGPLHRDKNIFYSDISAQKCGFGCYFRYTLLSLLVCDSLHFTPVVGFSGENFYCEDHPVNGAENVYEYYFVQPAEVPLEDVKKSYRVFTAVRGGGMLLGEYELGHYKITYDNTEEQYLTRLGQIRKKYLHLNEPVKNFMNESFEKLFGSGFNLSQEKKPNKVLGIHIRGTDFALHWESHPNIVLPQEYQAFIDQALETGNFDRIFVATDDKNCLDWFCSHYKERVIFFEDVYRGTKAVNIASETTNRKNSHYLSGLEVLRDMYALAYCDGLVCGLSQVSICARIVNRSIEKKYSFEKVLSNGIYSSEKNEKSEKKK